MYLKNHNNEILYSHMDFSNQHYF